MNRLALARGTVLLFALGILLTQLAHAQQAATVTINPVGGSGVMGTANLSAAGNATSVTLNMRGFAPNSQHAAHIHLGTCAASGGIQFDLGTLNADASGAATLSTQVAAPLSSLMDGNHLVMAHAAAPPSFGPAVACGDIPTGP